MNQSGPQIVAVFGGYKHAQGDPIYELAVETGRLIAEQGWVLMNGGYGGSMEASSRGARSAGGYVIGVTCDVFSRSPNQYVAETIATSDLWQRIREMVERAHGFITLPGATGTLAEIAMAWEFLCKGFVEPKPLLLFEFWRPLHDLLVSRQSIRAAAGGMVRVVQAPQEAIDTLHTLWRE